MFHTDKKFPQITIIVGTQWGDEGKGKITDYCAKDADYVVRFQGGANAEHTVVANCKIYQFHLVPAGILNTTATCVIGNGVMVNPKILQQEILNLITSGITPNLKISERAHLVMPYHIVLDELIARHQGDIGVASMKQGICAAVADKAYRQGIRVGDLLDLSLFKKKLTIAYEFNIKVITQVFNHPFPKEENAIYEEYLVYGDALKPYIANTEEELNEAYKNGKTIVFEGAHGMSVDPDHGMYPYTTSTSCVAPYAGVGSGLALNCRTRRIGVAKAYVTRDGAGPLPSELPENIAKTIRAKGNEYSPSGRPKRIGWLDIVQLRHSATVNGLTELAMTKLDVLGEFKEISLCTGYQRQGKHYTDMPISITNLMEVEPVNQSIPGWGALTEDEIHHIIEKGYKALPDPMKYYIETIEQLLEIPVSIISLGPNREQTLLRS